MSGDHGDQLRVLEDDHLDAGFPDRRPGEDDVRPALDEHGHQRAHRRQREAHVDLGMLGDEGREPARESVRAHDAPGRHRQLTALEGEIAGPELLDLAHVLEDPHRELAERPTDVGELHVATHPLEQRQPEGRLEAADDAADRALGEAECLGSGGDVLALGNGQKRVQLIERDPGPRDAGDAAAAYASRRQPRGAGSGSRPLASMAASTAATDSSMVWVPLSTITSGVSGASYGSDTPVK